MLLGGFGEDKKPNKAGTLHLGALTNPGPGHPRSRRRNVSGPSGSSYPLGIYVTWQCGENCRLKPLEFKDLRIARIYRITLGPSEGEEMYTNVINDRCSQCSVSYLSYLPAY